MGSCVVFRQKLFCVVRGALRLCVFPVTQRLNFWNVGNWTESHHQSGCTFLRRSLIKMHFRLQGAKLGGKRNIKVDRGDGWLGWWSGGYEQIVQGDGWGFESQPNRENSLTYTEKRRMACSTRGGWRDELLRQKMRKCWWIWFEVWHQGVWHAPHVCRSWTLNCRGKIWGQENLWT